MEQPIVRLGKRDGKTVFGKLIWRTPQTPIVEITYADGEVIQTVSRNDIQIGSNIYMGSNIAPHYISDTRQFCWDHNKLPDEKNIRFWMVSAGLQRDDELIASEVNRINRVCSLELSRWQQEISMAETEIENLMAQIRYAESEIEKLETEQKEESA